ncbi:mitochondrial import inner membrane translocase subunit tim21 [Coniothyrium glycines]
MAAVYRPSEAIALLRPSFALPRIQPRAGRPPAMARQAFSTSRHAQAAQTTSGTPPPPPPPRRSITLAGDTGRVRWSDLSPGEKAVRTTQQSINLVVVVVGIVATAGVGYVLFSDVFSPSSKTAHFNRATTMIRADAQCQKLLGPGPQISAHGESSWSRWARNRHISSATETDKWGTEHLRLKFYVEGPLGQGVAHVHLTKRPSQNDYEYETLAVDVKGHQRIHLIAEDKKEKVAPKIFGARWW